MNLDDFLKALRDFNAALPKELPRIMAALALDAKDMIEQRVTTTGQSATGEKFGDYVEGPYKEMRNERGLETSYVDFRNTNEMWRSISVVGTKITANLATATIGSETQDGEDKLEWQHDRYDKEVLALTQEEIKELEETATKEIQALLDKFIG